jgi:bisphosphoglycerate-independent phosphoglycerate mutase (AlkP superfamily)
MPDRLKTLDLKTLKSIDGRYYCLDQDKKELLELQITYLNSVPSSIIRALVDAGIFKVTEENENGTD